MTTIKFQEIIEASSQKSILSGTPGFGIRTYTKGMDPDTVRKISEDLNCSYDIPVNRQVTFSKLQEDPKIVTRYPRTLKYSEVKGANGEQLYAVACSTYVGIDYGFFCGMESARRIGANYIADILVFNERPAASTFYQLVAQKAFRPLDNTCVPDNPELKELLTGEPSLLEPRSIELPDEGDQPDYIDQLTGTIALAFLQTKLNADLGKEETLTDIVINAEENMTPDILKAMAALPDELVSDKYFQTNYLQGYGVPTGYRMVFLNEYNEDEVYTDNYVYLDLRSGSSKNITSNYYFEQIENAAAANNYPLFRALCVYLLNTHVSATTDYQFVYKLFAATEGGVSLSVADLTTDFFEKVEALHLQGPKRDALKKTIAAILNPALTDGDEGALSITKYLVETESDLLTLTKETRSSLTERIFSRSNLGKFASKYGTALIDYVNTRQTDDSTFFAAMQSVDDAPIWGHLVRFQYGSALEDKADAIITTIFQTRIIDREALIVRLFPVEDNQQLFHNYLKIHPERIVQLNGIVLQMVDLGGEKALLKILSETNFGDSSFDVLQPIASDFFSRGVKENAYTGTKAIEEFLKQLPKDKSHKFDFRALIDVYAQECEKHPGDADLELIEYLSDNAQKSDFASPIFGYITELRDPKVNVNSLDGNALELKLARRLPVDEEKLVTLFSLYLKHDQPHRSDIEQFFGDGSPLSFNAVSQMVLALWQQRNYSEDYRRSHVNSIIKAAKWKKDDRKRFIASCKDPELVAALSSSNGVFGKIKSLFTKKK